MDVTPRHRRGPTVKNTPFLSRVQFFGDFDKKNGIELARDKKLARANAGDARRSPKTG